MLPLRVPSSPPPPVPVPVPPPVTPPDSTPPAIPAGVLDPAVMMAILDVESGAAFGEGGRLVIRFEAHVFRDRLRNKFHDQLRSDVLFSAHFQIADSQPWAAPQYARENESSPWWAIHTGSQADEWRAFELAGERFPIRFGLAHHCQEEIGQVRIEEELLGNRFIPAPPQPVRGATE